MGLWAFSQVIGYIIWINIDLRYQFIKWLLVAAIFFVISIVDVLTFLGHPAQVNIFVEDASRSQIDLEIFESLNAKV